MTVIFLMFLKSNNVVGKLRRYSCNLNCLSHGRVISYLLLGVVMRYGLTATAVATTACLFGCAVVLHAAADFVLNG
jgi:hypothetical protein